MTSDDAGNFQEPPVTINGEKLSTAQAMTVRVAIQTFDLSLAQTGLGDDYTGRKIAEGYRRCVREINHLCDKRG